MSDWYGRIPDDVDLDWFHIHETKELKQHKSLDPHAGTWSFSVGEKQGSNSWEYVLEVCGVMDWEAKVALSQCGVSSSAKLLSIGYYELYNLCNGKLLLHLWSKDNNPFAHAEKVEVPSETFQKLSGFIEWAQWSNRLGLEPQNELFSQNALKWGLARVPKYHRGVWIAEHHWRSNIPMFTDNGSYQSWQGKLCNYLAQYKGKMGLPLSYLLRKEKVPKKWSVFQFVMDIGNVTDKDLEELVCFSGDEFKADNNYLYYIVMTANKLAVSPNVLME